MSAIADLASLTPTELIKKPLSHFAEIGASLFPEDIAGYFASYSPLDRGNTKLSNNILIFSTIPVVTCPRRCPGCYDFSSLRRRNVREKRIVNTLLATAHPDYLFHQINRQLIYSRTCEYVRIHVGGDYFSQEYVNRWCTMAAVHPYKKFFTHTKTGDLNATALRNAGINVVNSLTPDGRLNYGDQQYIESLAMEFDGKICPITTGKLAEGECGRSCTYCADYQWVFFKKHR